MKKLSKNQREKIEEKVEFKKITWFVFITGILFFFGGLYRFLYTNPTITMSARTKHPVMFDGSYLIFLGVIMMTIGIYRVFFYKKN